MAITVKYELCAVQIGTVVIGQLTEQAVNINVSKVVPVDSASIYARAAASEFEEQRISFTTNAIKTALGEVALTGKLIDGSANFTAYFKKISHGANIAAAGCIKIVYASGMVFWKTMEAPKRGLATCGFEFIAASADGTTAPHTLTTDQAMPVVTTEEMYVCGGAGVESWSIDTGIEELVEGDAAADYPTLVALQKCLPTVQATKFDSTGGPQFATLGSVVATDLTAGARRGSSPITLTFNEELSPATSIDGMAQFEGTLLYDGTNAPIVLTGLT